MCFVNVNTALNKGLKNIFNIKFILDIMGKEYQQCLHLLYVQMLKCIPNNQLN